LNYTQKSLKSLLQIKQVFLYAKSWYTKVDSSFLTMKLSQFFIWFRNMGVFNEFGFKFRKSQNIAKEDCCNNISSIYFGHS